MTDAPTLSPDATPTAPPLGPPPIVWLHSAAGFGSLSYRTDVLRTFRFLVILLVLLTGGLMGVAALQGHGLDWILMIMIGFQWLIFVLLLGFRLIGRVSAWRADRKRHADEVAAGDTSATAVVNGALLDLGGLCRLHWLTGRPRKALIGQFQQRLIDAGLPRAMMLVDASIAEPIQAMEIPEDFLEPDRLLRQTPRKSWSFVLIVLITIYFAFGAVAAFGNGDWIVASIDALIACLFGVRILASFGVHVSESRAPIMAMGVLIDHKNRRWTVQDSCAYLYRIKGKTSSPVLVELIGPDGLGAVVFPRLDDAGFRFFWQRWMHPHPRPDLV